MSCEVRPTTTGQVSRMEMLSLVTEVRDRTVVRCDLCHLVQFPAVSHSCRRCGQLLAATRKPDPVFVASSTVPVSGNGRGHPTFAACVVAAAIHSLRLRNGLSQRQLAGRMSGPRTYISKIENEKATPTLSSLERVARALEVSVPELLSGGEKSRQDEISDLVKDQFIAEILPFVSQLNGMQMSSILTQVRDLTIRPRRTA